MIGVIAAIPFLYRQVDEQICRRFEDHIAQHYPGLKVTVRSAEFVAGEGIKVRGISIVEPSAEGPRAELLSIEELFLVTKTELKELLVRDPVITRVSGAPSDAARHAAIGRHVERGETFSAAEIRRSSAGSDRRERHDRNFRSHEKPLRHAAAARRQSDDSSHGRNRCPTAPRKEIRELQGMFACDYFRRVEFHGSVDPQSGACTLSTARRRGLDISPELRDALPEPLCSKMHAWGELRAEGKFDFQIAYDPARPTPFEFRIDGSIVRGQINDPRLPHPLTDVQANFRADNSGFIIDDLKAKCGQASIRIFDCQCAGYEPDSPKSLKAEVRQLELDPELFAVLPAALAGAVGNLSAAGQNRRRREARLRRRNVAARRHAPQHERLLHA